MAAKAAFNSLIQHKVANQWDVLVFWVIGVQLVLWDLHSHISQPNFNSKSQRGKFVETWY